MPLAVMALKSGDAETTLTSLGCLEVLADNSECVKAAAAGGAVEAVVAALNTALAANDQDVATTAMNTLTKMARTSTVRACRSLAWHEHAGLSNLAYT